MKKTPVVLGLLLCSACSGSWIGSNGEGEHPIKRSFVVAAEQNHVPIQLLLATAWLESRMTANATGVVYNNDIRLGIQSAETAFGVPLHKLTPFSREEEDLTQLDTQVAAYARLVRAHLDDHSIHLDTNMHENKHVLAWVQELAQLQRTGDKYRNNTRSLFALEMLAVLNNGFEWRDPITGEEIVLPPSSSTAQTDTYPLPCTAIFQSSHHRGAALPSTLVATNTPASEKRRKPPAEYPCHALPLLHFRLSRTAKRPTNRGQRRPASTLCYSCQR